MLCNANYNSSYIQKDFFSGRGPGGCGIGRKRVRRQGEGEKGGSDQFVHLKIILPVQTTHYEERSSINPRNT